MVINNAYSRVSVLNFVNHCFMLTFLEILFENSNSGAQYSFESETGRLMEIKVGYENDTITVQYLNQTYPALLTHSNGRQIRITYSENKVIYVDLADEDGSILKSW